MVSRQILTKDSIIVQSQRLMERTIPGIKLQDRGRNVEISRRTKVQDDGNWIIASRRVSRRS